MYEVRADIARNRLYIVLDGFFTDEQAVEAFEAVKAGVDQLQPGFDVINDVRTFKPASPEVAAYIAKGQQYEIKHGLNRVVRVLGAEIIGQMQFERLSKETGLTVIGATSVKAAEKLLDE